MINLGDFPANETTTTSTWTLVSDVSVIHTYPKNVTGSIILLLVGAFLRSYNTLLLSQPFVRILLDYVVLELPCGNLSFEHEIDLVVTPALHFG